MMKEVSPGGRNAVCWILSIAKPVLWGGVDLDYPSMHTESASGRKKTKLKNGTVFKVGIVWVLTFICLEVT